MCIFYCKNFQRDIKGFASLQIVIMNNILISFRPFSSFFTSKKRGINSALSY